MTRGQRNPPRRLDRSTNLRPAVVLRSGAVYGCLAGLVEVVAVFLTPSTDRADVAAVISGCAALSAVVTLVAGSLFWFGYRDGLLLMREMMRRRGRWAAGAAFGPAAVRVGSAAAVLAVISYVSFIIVERA